ncbi:hypothetical protein J6590_079967 [Homalodisca vitripennis]|nr:hypothetical protein J6590_079967 [Homalodisca vitripennis]
MVETTSRYKLNNSSRPTLIGQAPSLFNIMCIYASRNYQQVQAEHLITTTLIGQAPSFLILCVYMPVELPAGTAEQLIRPTLIGQARTFRNYQQVQAEQLITTDTNRTGSLIFNIMCIYASRNYQQVQAEQLIATDTNRTGSLII